MSFEDDEYWEEQYSDHYGVASAVARDRYPEPHYPESYSPEPIPGVSRRDDGRPRPVVRTSTWDGEIGPGPDQPDIDLDAPPPDELAARRRRRSAGARSPRPGPPRGGAPGGGFDNARPGWLDDPEFVPTDVSGPDLAGPDSDVLDFNRPELGANFDNPEYAAPVAPRPRRAPKSGPDFADPDFVHGYGDGYDDAQYAADLAREAARHAGARVEFDDGGFPGDRAEVRGYAGRRDYQRDRPEDPRYLDDRAAEQDRPQRGGPRPDRGQVRPIRADRSRVSVDGVDDGPISGSRRADLQRAEDARFEAARAEAARLEAARHDAARHDAARHDAARHDAARHDAARHDAARADAARAEDQRGLDSAPMDDVGDGPIRPPGGRRGRRNAGPQGRPARRDERQLPPPPAAASGRARVPVPPMSEPAPDDALDLYRPPRDGETPRDEPRAPAAFAPPNQAPPAPRDEPRTPAAFAPPHQPTRDEPRAPAAFGPPHQPTRDEPRAPAAFAPPHQPPRDEPAVPAGFAPSHKAPRDEPRAPAAFGSPHQGPRDEPRLPASFAPSAQPAGAGPDADTPRAEGDETPRVVRKDAPPTTPRVISKAAPPATPKIIKKADPPAIPRVIKVEPPAAPARVIPATPPGTPARPDIAAASRPAPPSPNPDAPGRPATTPPAAHRPDGPNPPATAQPAAAHRPDGANTPATQPPAAAHWPDGANTPATAQPPAAAHRPDAAIPRPDSAMAAPPAAYRPTPGTAAPDASSRPAAGGPNLVGPTADQRLRGGDQRGSADPVVPQSPAGRSPAPAHPAGPRPEDLRPARLPHIPGQSPVAGTPDIQRRPDAVAFGSAPDGTATRPAWAHDTPVAGSPRVRPAHPDRQPHARPPATPPQAAPRPEPMPINGAVPRQVDAPTPRAAGHRATPDQQSFPTPHNPQRPNAAPDQPQAPNAARHSIAADRPAWQPPDDQGTATRPPARQEPDDQSVATQPPAPQPADDRSAATQPSAWHQADDRSAATQPPARQPADDRSPATQPSAWQQAEGRSASPWQQTGDHDLTPNSPAWQRPADQDLTPDSPAGLRESPAPAGRHGEAEAPAAGFLTDRRQSAPAGGTGPSHRADEVPVAGTRPAAAGSAGASPQTSADTRAGSHPATPGDPVPIGKLATSGPDTTKRRYADADLGATWFTAKTPAVPASEPANSDGSAATAQPSGTDAPPAGTATQPAGAGTAPAGTPSRPAESTPDDGGAGRAETAGPGPSAHGAGVDVGPTRPIPRPATSDDAARTVPDSAGDQASVVIDLDITGLINGLGMTSEQPVIAARNTGAATDGQGHTTADNPTTDGTDPQAPDGRPTDAQVPHGRTADAHAPHGRTPDGTAAQRPAGGDAHEGAGHPETDVEAAGQRAVQPGPAAGPGESAARPLKPLAAEDLEAIRWRLDGGTLREVVDDRDALRELAGRLDEPLAEEQDNVTRSGLLSVRAEVYRLLGELGLAAAASRLALAHAEAAGDVQSIVIAQAELAHVLRLRGDFAEADRLFEEAASSESPEVLRSVVHENAGRCSFDQGRHMEALDHFARAIRLGSPDDLDLVERIGVCLEAVYIHVLRDGWGPYPRLRREILGPVRGPHPAPAAAPTANRGSTLD